MSATRARRRTSASSNGTAAVTGKTVTIPPRCKPSKVTSSDFSRPILNHGYLRRREDALWLCTTDAYVAAAIKVEGDADEGYIPVGALRLMETGQQAEQVSATAWMVHTRDGTVTFDIAETLAGKTAYPDLEGVGLWDAPGKADIKALARGDEPIAVGVNPQLLDRLATALGARNGCRFEITGPLKAMRVIPLGEFDRLGLQMPIRLNV